MIITRTIGACLLAMLAWGCGERETTFAKDCKHEIAEAEQRNIKGGAPDGQCNACSGGPGCSFESDYGIWTAGYVDQDGKRTSDECAVEWHEVDGLDTRNAWCTED